MSDLSEVFRAGAANAWIFAPSAVALGALHGLEPGHSKTMMAAFIVAVRGTVAQAVLLGVAATISHTAIVWAVALTGLYLGAQLNVEANEPYLQIVSGALIIAVALWMMWRSWRDIAAKGAVTAPTQEGGRLPIGASAAHGHSHDDAHVHGHVDSDVHAMLRTSHDGGVPHSHQEEEFESELLDVDPTVYADAHEREHALDIERRFAQSPGYDRSDYRLRTDGRTYSLSRVDHGAVALPADRPHRFRRAAGVVLQRRPRVDDGSRRSGGGAWRSSCLDALVGIGRHRGARALCFERHFRLSAFTRFLWA